MDKTSIISKKLKEYRKEAGFNQECIAEYLGVDQSYISKIENGERCLSADMLEKLGSLYGVFPYAFENDEPSPRHLNCAFRGSNLSVEDMGVISAINAIALNTDFMTRLLEGEDN